MAKARKQDGLRDVVIRGWDQKGAMTFIFEGRLSRYGAKKEIERLKLKHPRTADVEVDQ